MQPMDHFTLTLIIGAIEVLFIPWAAWVTVRAFELTQKISVLQNQMENEIKIQKLQNNSINTSLQKMEGEIDDIKKELDSGFKDILNELRK